MRSLSWSALAGLSLFSLSAVWSSAAQAQCVDLATAATAVSENFDSLANTGTSSATPQGWFFAETGTNANTTYSTSTGTSNAGDTYSFGAAAASERAFGGLQSGSLTPTVGGCFTNNTGDTVTSTVIAYVGEQWRLGSTGRFDQMDFEFSTDATSLTTGTWTDFNSLDFVGPNANGTAGALDGNLPANRAVVSATLGGLSVAAGSDLWIRWSSFNATGADDGLAIDDFNLVPITTGPSSIQFQPSVMTTTENGLNIAYSVVLPYAPLPGETVTITPASNDVTEGTVSGPIMFTAANWDIPQFITVNPGAAGDGNDGDVMYNIDHTVASTGGLYAGQTAGSVSVTNANIDGIATISVDPSSAILVNEDGSMTQVVTIEAGPDVTPSADVSIDLTNNSPAEVALSTTTVVLTAGNGYTSTVTITGVLDAIAEPDMPFSVTTASAVSADASFNGINPLDISGIVLDSPAVVDADLTMLLTDSPDPVVAGTNLSYTATLTNNGPADAQDATIDLPLPAITTFVSLVANGGACTSPAVGATGTVNCTWAGATGVGAGNARSITVVALVPADTADGTALNAVTTASGSTNDPTPINDTATAATAVIANADLSITLADAPDPVTAGTNLTYTATATNNGISDAQGVNISLPLPAGTSFVSATPSAGGACNAASPVLCTWAGATAPAGVRSVSIVAAVAPATTGALTATATAASATNDPNPGDNSASADTTVIVSSDMSITLTDSPDPVTAGTNLSYTAVVTNGGPSDATGVTITLPLPANTSFVSGSVTGGGSCAGSPVVCTVTGSIAPNTSRTATITMLVSPSAPNGSSIAASATVASVSPDPNGANNTASTTTAVVTEANLDLTLTASSLAVLTNVPVTFTAVSLNLGPSDAQNLSITIQLTPDFRYTGHTATGATCTTPQVGTTGSITCTWAGATALNASRTLDVVAFSNNEGATAVNASTVSDTSDPVTANNVGNVSVQVGFPVEAIPTLSQYSLILLGLMLGLIGFVAVRRQA